ncbi:MAG TPA: hypothetical protein VLK65_25065 [Vicinamibacteria bacterium]|nr:hypothetical protein [Vicinamibacteria bacterium]
MALPGFVLLLLVLATWVAPLWPELTVLIQAIIGGIGCATIIISQLSAVAGPASDRPPRLGLLTARQARRARSARAGWVEFFFTLPVFDAVLGPVVNRPPRLGPLTARPARDHFVSAALAPLGVRVDNLLPACGVFLAVTAGLTAPALIGTRTGAGLPFPLGELPRYFLWALFQQFVAIGAFWLPFRRAMGLSVEEVASFSREVAVAAAAALVFVVAHAPNPGLMLLGGVAELAWLSLFGRFRNLFALSLAHAAAALVVSHHLVPSVWLTSMRVGPSYWEL